MVSLHQINLCANEMNLCNSEKLQMIAPVLSEVEEEAQGVLLKRTPDDHDHNASNHCHVGASAFDGKNAYASPLWSASDGRRQLLSARQLFTAESPIA